MIKIQVLENVKWPTKGLFSVNLIAIFNHTYDSETAFAM